MPDWRALGSCQKGSAGVGLATALLDTGVRMLLCAFEKTDYCAVDVDFNLAGRMTGLGCWSAQRRRRARRQEQLRTYPFFYQHGALVVRQAERLSKIARRAADTAAQGFRDKAILMGFPGRSRSWHRVHTHQFAQYFGAGGVWIFETGCVAETPDYDTRPKLIGAPRPPALGYRALVQEYSETDAAAGAGSLQDFHNEVEQMSEAA
jgi:hypothetical protein